MTQFNLPQDPTTNRGGEQNPPEADRIKTIIQDGTWDPEQWSFVVFKE